MDTKNKYYLFIFLAVILCLNLIILRLCFKNYQYNNEGRNTAIENINPSITDNPNNLGTQKYLFDSIPPNWVKQKESADEYEFLKVMNTRFAIEYPFLKRELSEDRKKEVFETIEALVNEIKEGKHESNYPITFSVFQ